MSVEDFPKIESKQEKTREKLLEEFKDSLEEYGVKGIEIRLEGDKLVMEQKYGEGIRGFGYDKEKKNLWLCLDQKNLQESTKENQRWNANTILDLEKEFSGVVLEKIEERKVKIEIDAEHPICAMLNLIGKEKKAYLSGELNGWKLEKPLEFNENGKLEGELLWDGNKPIECKIAISNIESSWKDGEWEDDARQIMKINLGKENKEE